MNFKKYLQNKNTHPIKHPIVGIIGISFFLLSIIFTYNHEINGSTIYNTYKSYNFISSFSLTTGYLLFTIFLYFNIREILKSVTNTLVVFIPTSIAIVFVLVSIISTIKVTYQFAKDAYHLSSGAYETTIGLSATETIIRGVIINIDSLKFEIDWMNRYPKFSKAQVKLLRSPSLLKIKYYDHNKILEIEKIDNKAVKLDK